MRHALSIVISGLCGGGIIGCDPPITEPPSQATNGEIILLSHNTTSVLLEQEPNDDLATALNLPDYDVEIVTILGVIQAGGAPPDSDVIRLFPENFRLMSENSSIAAIVLQGSSPDDPSPDFNLQFLSSDGSLLDEFSSTNGRIEASAIPSEPSSIPDSSYIAITSTQAFAYKLTIDFTQTTSTQSASTASKSITSSPASTRVIVPANVTELLAIFRTGTSQATRIAIADQCNLDVLDASPSGVCRLRIRDRAATAAEKTAILQSLTTHPTVRFAEPNGFSRLQKIPSDPLFPDQWNLDAINAPDAWDITTGSENIVVAIIDSGVRFDHPDLNPRLIDGYDFVSNADVSLDGDGRDPDATDPGDRPTNPERSTFHGTRIAGIIAAESDNNLGVAGITWSTKLLPVRAFGRSGVATDFDLSEAIRYAAGLPNVSEIVPTNPANVINLSLARSPGSPIPQCVEDAIRDAYNAGVTMVAAAGNNATSDMVFPAAFEEVISVGAINRSGDLASYSNFGPWIDLVAPGGEAGEDSGPADAGDDTGGDAGTVESNDDETDTQPTAILSTAASSDGETIDPIYDDLEGTSLACAHASATAALLLAIDPNLTPSDIRTILTETATDLGNVGEDDRFGAGRLNASAAVQRARIQSTAPTTPPSLLLSATALTFDNQQNRLIFDILNTGGDVLNIASIRRDDYGDLTDITIETTGGNANTNIARVAITLDRSPLAINAQSTRLIIEPTNAAPDYIDIHATSTPPTTSDESVTILALDPQTSRILTQSTTTLAARTFTFTEPPDRPFILIAGTDRDGDGQICEPGDMCGMINQADAPRIVSPANLASQQLIIILQGPL